MSRRASNPCAGHELWLKVKHVILRSPCRLDSINPANQDTSAGTGVFLRPGRELADKPTGLFPPVQPFAAADQQREPSVTCDTRDA